jgi:hypothetical protein
MDDSIAAGSSPYISRFRRAEKDMIVCFVETFTRGALAGVMVVISVGDFAGWCDLVEVFD